MHYIMSKDIPVMEIETAKIIDKDRCPLALKFKNVNIKTIYKWIQHRALPLNRKNSDKIYKALNLPRDNMEVELMYITHSLSINDNYWIANDNEVGKLKYDTISIFKNSLNNTMYMVALKGADGFTISEKEISAEYTGQGTFPKCFIREDNDLYMYKSGNIINVTRELLAGFIAEILGFKSVKYEYTKLFDLDCTKSKIVTNEKVNWETAFILCESLQEKKFIPQDFAQKYFAIDYSNMIIFDAIVLNEDRHMKNWAIEMDADTNRILGLAPSFDYNNSFMADSHTMSNLIFDGPKKMNILRAAKESYRLYGTTLNLRYLYDIINQLDININKQSLKNRIEYIVGIKDNQRNCYEK